MSTATKSSTAATSHAVPAPELDDLPVRASAYPMKKVEWLWPGRIPIGKVTLLVGDPGLGKSLLAIDAAARVTTATPWPDELPTQSLAPSATTDLHQQPPSAACVPPPSTLPPPPSPPGSVLILSAEDKIADTIRPRLAAHGADEDRVYFAPSVSDLRHDLARLERTLDHIPDCRLIIVDPVNAYVGSSDSHFHTIIRKVLAPFAELADRKRIAILAVTHLRKNVGAALHRATGSMAFVASARTVWCVARDPEDPDRNLLLPIKNNLRALGTGLAYSIASNHDLEAATIHWHCGDIEATAEEVFAASARKRGPDAIECRAAADWLSNILAVNPQPAAWIAAEAKQYSFHPRTLRRALHYLGGSTTMCGTRHNWVWQLPHTEFAVSTPTWASPSAWKNTNRPLNRGSGYSTRQSPPPPPTNPRVTAQSTPPAPSTNPVHSPRPNPQPDVPSPAVKKTCPLAENSSISPSTSPPTPPPPIASSATTNHNPQPSPPRQAPLPTHQPTTRAPASPTPHNEPPSPNPQSEIPNPQSAHAPHPLNGHPLISQILWPLRTPPLELKTQPPPQTTDPCTP